uniref:Uncharacterized protein n=1 Tax=Panagrellus redivivus TaxID=6233 RepID=A0A7E4VQS7_PANRE
MSRRSTRTAIRPLEDDPKTKLSAERDKLQHELCLIGETENPHCVMARRKLNRRIAQITHILDTVASPSTRTAKSPEAVTAVLISSPKTAVSPNLERSEENVTTLKAVFEPHSLNLENIRRLAALFAAEKVFVAKCLEKLRQDEKKAMESVAKQIQKAEKAKAEVDAIMAEADKESGQLEVVTEEIGEVISVLEDRATMFQGVVENWNELTSKLNVERRLKLSWAMKFIKIVYTVLVFFLYAAAMIRDAFIDAGKTYFARLQIDDDD